MTEPVIIARLEATLEKMRAQQVEARSINLCPTDLDAFNAVMTARWNEGRPRSERVKVYAHGYRDHPVRPGNVSKIYSKQGVGFTVCRLSKRTMGPQQ